MSCSNFLGCLLSKTFKGAQPKNPLPQISLRFHEQAPEGAMNSNTWKQAIKETTAINNEICIVRVAMAGVISILCHGCWAYDFGVPVAALNEVCQKVRVRDLTLRDVVHGLWVHFQGHCRECEERGFPHPWLSFRVPILEVRSWKSDFRCVLLYSALYQN